MRWPLLCMLTLALAGGVAVAGCGDPPAKADEAPSALQQADEAAAAVDVQATPSTGVIRGVVVDQAVRPLADAVVRIEGLEREATTASNGAFGFDDLAPGTYFLTATRERYEGARVGVVVEPNVAQPEAVRVVMAAIPSLAPFVESFSAKLFVAFSFPMVGAVGGSTVGLDDNDHRVAFEIQPNATVMQMEVAWDAATPAGEHVYLFGSASEDGDPLDIQTLVGPSPLAIQGNGTQDGDVADGLYFGVQAVPRGFTSTAAPDPNGLLLVNQGFDGFANVFHNFRPDEGWTFIADGPHPIPPP